MLKRLEQWASDSPERSRMLVVLICLGLGAIVVLFVMLLGWLALTPKDIKDLTR